MKKLAWAVAGFLMIGASNAYAVPITVDGITFPGGVASFADAVVSYAAGTNVSAPFDDPTRAQGVPDAAAVALGVGGTLIVQFTDNSLTTSGDATPDLHVFEIGPVVEIFNLAISIDGFTWIDLGNVLGQPTSVDIDGKAGVVAGTQYSFVRLVDIAPSQSSSPFAEADIDAIGAISSAAAVTPVPEPGSLVLMSAAVLGMGAVLRRRRAR